MGNYQPSPTNPEERAERLRREIERENTPGTEAYMLRQLARERAERERREAYSDYCMDRLQDVGE